MIVKKGLTEIASYSFASSQKLLSCALMNVNDLTLSTEEGEEEEDEEEKCQLINSVIIAGYIDRYHYRLSDEILKIVDDCQKLVF